MNTSAKMILIVSIILDGFSLVNHRQLTKYPNFPAIWYNHTGENVVNLYHYIMCCIVHMSIAQDRLQNEHNYIMATLQLLLEIHCPYNYYQELLHYR